MMNNFKWNANMLAMANALDGKLRMAGGCVRDQLMGQDPSDYDFCTPMMPHEVVLRMSAVPGVTYVLPTGIDHGTITVLFKDGSAYEVTTLRLDVETDGRHATVQFTDDWEADAARRDFTINAMMADASGNLYDWFGGEADLRAGVVRFVGDADSRLREDYLRALRYYRFYARFGKTADYSTLEALTGASSNLWLVSAERVWSEFCKLVAVEDKPKVADAIRMMCTTMNAVDSGLFSDHQAVQYAWGDNIAELPRIVTEYSTPAVIWAMLAKAVDPSTASEEVLNAADRLKWSTAEKNQALYTVKTHRDGSADRIRAAAKYDYLVSGINRDWVIEAYGYQLKSRDAYPAFPVNGHDIMHARPGIAGPEIGAMLRSMKHAWYNSGFNATKEELIEMYTT